MNQLTDTTAIVTGAGRGFGRAIAGALIAAGAQVVGVARTRAQLDDVRHQLGHEFTAVVADAAAPATAVRLLAEYRPELVVLAAGAAPRMAPLQEQSWESFSQIWNVDVAQAFQWVRQALRAPLAPGSSVIAISSGAALKGSPLSGGYAGAKGTVRTIAAYAALESERSGLGIRFVSVLPQLTAETTLGAAAVAAYAERAGVEVDVFTKGLMPTLTAEAVGQSVRDIAIDGHHPHGAYALTGDGLSPLM